MSKKQNCPVHSEGATITIDPPVLETYAEIPENSITLDCTCKNPEEKTAIPPDTTFMNKRTPDSVPDWEEEFDKEWDRDFIRHELKGEKIEAGMKHFYKNFISHQIDLAKKSERERILIEGAKHRERTGELGDMDVIWWNDFLKILRKNKE